MDKTYPKAGVGIVVIKKENGKEYIMLHRRKGARGLGKGYWGSGGGHLELGESLQAAALRELREEAGDQLVVGNVRFAGVSNFTQLQPKHYVDISFIADWVSGEPINAEPEVTTEWQWFPIDDLPTPLFPPVANYIKGYQTGRYFFDASFADAA